LFWSFCYLALRCLLQLVVRHCERRRRRRRLGAHDRPSSSTRSTKPGLPSPGTCRWAD